MATKRVYGVLNFDRHTPNGKKEDFYMLVSSQTERPIAKVRVNFTTENVDLIVECRHCETIEPLMTLGQVFIRPGIF